MAGQMAAEDNRQDADGVLRRLLQARDQSLAGAGRAPQLPRPVKATPARAAATAIGRAADRLYHLAVQPISVTPGALMLAELPEYLPEPALLTLLQGPGDALGVAALCGEAVTALIEVQALGRVTARPSERRRPTRADAMICAEFINRLLSELAAELGEIEGFDGFDGYRYATHLDDPRPLSLMLEDKPYRSLVFKLRLGNADTRDVTIFMALPQMAGVTCGKPKPAGKAGAAASQTDAGAPAKAEAGVPAAPQATLEASVRAAPVELVGILCRRRITLGELRGLTAGRTLSLPRVNLDEARIETPAGQLVATGKFGETEGCHAIRLRDPLAVATPKTVPLAAPASPSVGKATQAHLRDEPPMDDLQDSDDFRTGAGPGAAVDQIVPATMLKAGGSG